MAKAAKKPGQKRLVSETDFGQEDSDVDGNEDDSQENEMLNCIIDNATITNSDLNRPFFAWYPYGKSGLFRTELVIA